MAFCLLAQPLFPPGAVRAEVQPPACDFQFFPPQKFIRTTGPKTEYIVNVRVPAWVVSPYELRVQNGNPDGTQRVSSASIFVNGREVAQPSDFNQNVPSLTRTVALTAQSTLKVVLSSVPDSFLSIGFCGHNADHTPPRIEVREPAAGSTLNDATPVLRVHYEDLAGAGEPAASGVDLANLRIVLDGTDQTHLFTKGPAEAAAELPASLALAEGVHTLLASIKDQAGNLGQATSTFRVDLTPPAVQVSEPAHASHLNLSTPSVRVRYEDNQGLNPENLQVFINGADRTGLFLVGATEAAAVLTPETALPEGSNQITARVQDLGGNESVHSSAFIVDLQPPILGFAQPIHGSRHRRADVDVAVTYGDNLSLDLASFKFRVNGSLFDLTKSSTGATGRLQGLADGTHTLSAEIRDLAGNSVSVSITIRVDTVPPEIAVQKPAHEALLNAATPFFQINYSDAQGVDASSFRARLDGEDRTNLFTVGTASATAVVPDSLKLSEGRHTLTAAIEDLAGHKSEASASFTVDTRKPTGVLELPGEFTNTGSPRIQAGYSDEGTGVDTTSVTVYVDEADRTGLFTVSSTTAAGVVHGLADGLHKVRIALADRAGNTAEIPGSFTVDTASPTASFLAPPQGAFTNDATPALQLAYDDAGAGMDLSFLRVSLAAHGEAPADITSYFQAGPDQANGQVPDSAPLADGGHEVRAELRDRAGNQGTAAVSFAIDTVAPTYTLEAPDTSLYVTTATPFFLITYADDRSGVDAPRLVFLIDAIHRTARLVVEETRASGTLLPENALADGEHSMEFRVADRAGNTAVAQAVLKIDATQPLVSASLAPAPNAAGWNNRDVTVNFECLDPGSGIAECPAAQGVSTEGANQQVTGTARDIAGNTATATASVNLDKTHPGILAEASPPANPAGWHNTPLTVNFACSDALSGVAHCPEPVPVQGEARGRVVSGIARDAADNTASASITLNIDTTPPAVTPLLSPPPNAAGWHKDPVDVTFQCTDLGSGVVECPAGRPVAAEGAGQAVTGTARDAAGNATMASATVNLDKTAPLIAASPSPPANSHGWNNTQVTVAFDCSDALSGVAVCPEPITATQSGNVSGTATDTAGNQASAGLNLNIDTAAPSISASLTPPANAAGWNNSNVLVNFSCSDTGSGVAACPGAQSVTAETAGQIVTAAALDKAGNTAQTQVAVKLDRTPPALTVASPAEGAVVKVSPVSITGTAEDALSGVIAVTCGGAAAAVSGAAFTCERPLAEGSNAIALQARDAAGNIQTRTMTVIYRPNNPPAAHAGGPYAADVGSAITFDASASSDPDNDVLSYAWDFGDGNRGTGRNPRHSYATVGSFTAAVRVTDGRGGSAAASAEVTIRPLNQKPVAQAGGPYAGETEVPIGFDGSASRDPDNDPLAYLWTFGDGATGTGVRPSHVYGVAGTFPVGLTVTDGRGGSHSAGTQVTVRPRNHPPIANPGGPYNAETGTPLPFDGSGSSDPDNDVLTYSWLFGDGTAATGSRPSKTFASPGNFTVALTVSDGHGGQHTAQTTVSVVRPPNRAPVSRPGGPYAGEAGETLNFDGSASTDPDSDSLVYLWDFGDGATAEGARPTHAYTQAGDFTVTLIVTDPAGLSHTAAASAAIRAPADRTPPQVSLAGPREVLPGTRVQVSAQAADNVSVQKVALTVDGGDPVERLAPPYERIVEVPSVVAPGTKIQVAALARDPSGNEGIAELSMAVVAAPDEEIPSIVLHAPAEAAPGTTLHLSAQAADNVGVSTVTFFANGEAFASDREAPYEAAFLLEGVQPGDLFPLAAHAFDHAGNVARSTATVLVASTPDTTPPTVVLTAPAEARPGELLSFSAAASDNSGLSRVSFFADRVLLTALSEPPYTALFRVPAAARPGTTLSVEARARDFAGLEASDTAQILIRPLDIREGLVAGEVYDDTTGLPLAAVSVALSGRDAAGAAYTQTALTDERGRYALRANPGTGTLTAEKPGWTRSDRRVVIQAGEVTEAFDSRLTPVNSSERISGVLGGSVGSGEARLDVPAGALAADTEMSLVLLTPQGLQGRLPAGWSPVAAVDILPHGIPFQTAARVTVPNVFGLPMSSAPVVAAWDEAGQAWRTVAVSSMTEDSGPLYGDAAASGQFAWLVPDTAPAPPPQPQAGQWLLGVSTAPLSEGATAAVLPEPKIVFYQPGVRSDVAGVLSSTSPLPSGAALLASIAESYAFVSGAELRPEPYVQDIVFHQVSPGQGLSGTEPGTRLGARFPVSPFRVFDPLEFREGVITVALSEAADATGAQLIGSEGGTVSLDTGEALEIPAGATAQSLSVELARLAPEALALPPALEFLGGVRVSLSGGSLGKSATLSIARPAGLSENSQILLVSVQDVAGQTRLILAGLGRVTGNRVVSQDILPINQSPMDGIRGNGRYVFVQPAEPVGFAAGLVLGTAGQAFSGALVQSAAAGAPLFPVAALSQASGRYAAAAPVGTMVLTALDLVMTDVGTAESRISSRNAEIALDIRLASQPPRVVSVAPADGARNVPLSDPLIVKFSEPIDPATVSGAQAGNALLTKADNTTVPGAVALSGGNTVLTFRPSGPLASDTAYTFTVQGVKDLSGLALETPLIVRFTSLDTQPPAPPAAGQIAATIPDAEGNVTISASQGTAGTHDTVYILNITQGAIHPVLLEPDGSFSASISARVGDKLQIKIVDLAGNETVADLPRSRQTNPDGSVSAVMDAEGGRVEGPGGIAVDVPANAFPEATVVTVKSVTEQDFPVLLTEEQKQVLGYAGGVSLDFGGKTPEHYVNVSIPAGPDDKPEDQWVVGEAVTVDGVAQLNMRDTAKLIDGKIRTSSPPCPGVTGQGVYGIHKTKRPVGLNYGVMYSRNTGGLRMNIEFPFLGSLTGLFPYAALSYEHPEPVCLPALSGRVTVVPNKQRIVIPVAELGPTDREIGIVNPDQDVINRFPRKVVQLELLVDGNAADIRKVFLENQGSSLEIEPPVFDVVAVSSRTHVRLNMDKITTAFDKVSVKNITRDILQEFPQSLLDLKFPVPGGASDNYEVAISSVVGGAPRPVSNFTVESPNGPGNMLARAVPGAIDPTRAQIDQHNSEHPDNPIHGAGVVKVELLEMIPLQSGGYGPGQIFDIPLTTPTMVDGGFTYSFNSFRHYRFELNVRYEDGKTAGTAIPNFRITVNNPQTGAVIKTIEGQVPPRDEPLDLGTVTDDAERPTVESTEPIILDNINPGQILSIAFSEPLDDDVIRDGLRVLDSHGNVVKGEFRLTSGNRVATFVPDTALRLGETYTIDVSALRDPGGNVMDSPNITFKTFAPRRAARLQEGKDGRILESIRDVQILKKKDANGLIKTHVVAVSNAREGYKLMTFDVTDSSAPVEMGRVAGVPSKMRIRVVPQAEAALRVPVESGLCSVTQGGGLFKGDLAVATSFNTYFSLLNIYDITDLDNPCFLANRIMTANPENIADYSRRGTVKALGFAKGVDVVRHTGGIAAFAAVENVGLFAVEIGQSIPSFGPVDRQTPAYYPGDFVDVAAIRDRLVALDRGNFRLDVLDPNLTPISSLDLPGQPRRLAFAQDFQWDENKDGIIQPDESKDLAFVAMNHCPAGVSGPSHCPRTIQVVDLTRLEAPEIMGDIPMPGIIRELAYDPGLRRLYAGGHKQASSGSGEAFYAVDVSSPRLKGLIDLDGDPEGWDDRILWHADYPEGINGFQVEPDLGLAYVGGSRAVNTPPYSGGRLDIWEISPQNILAPDEVRVVTYLDRINKSTDTFQGDLVFALPFTGEVTIKVDDKVIEYDLDGQSSTDLFENKPVSEGVHRVRLKWKALPLPGQHTYEIVAVKPESGARKEKKGKIEHVYQQEEALPVGHTFVKGVDVADGHLTVQREDFTIPGAGPVLQFVRSYSSQGHDDTGPMGAGWTHNYNSFLIKDHKEKIYVVGGEGTGTRFLKEGSGFKPQEGYHGELKYDESKDHFDFFTKTRRLYRYERAPVPVQSFLQTIANRRRQVGDPEQKIYRLAFEQDTRGNKLVFSYNDKSPYSLKSVKEEATGRELAFTYKPFHSDPFTMKPLVIDRIEKITGPLNLEITFEYDEHGNLKKAKRGRRVETYEYKTVKRILPGTSEEMVLDRHNLVKIKGPNNPENDPTNAGADPNTDVIEYEYYQDGDSLPGETQASRSGEEPFFIPLKHELVKKVIEGPGTPDEAATRFSYDYSGLQNTGQGQIVTQVTQAPGQPEQTETTYTVHPRGSVKKIQTGSNVTEMVWSFEVGIDDVYLKKLKDPNLRETEYEYDAKGNMTHEKIKLNLAGYAPVVDGQGNPVSGEVITEYRYNQTFGKLEYQRDGEGNEIFYDLDPDTGDIRSVKKDPRDGTGPVETKYTYKDFGSLKGLLETITDPNGHVTTYSAYDAFGNPRAIQGPTGIVSSQAYDDRSRLLTFEDTSGRKTENQSYDNDWDRPKKVVKRAGSVPSGMVSDDQVTETVYRAGGQVQSVTNGLGHIKTYAYDALNRVSRETDTGLVDADGGNVTIETTFGYDRKGNKTRESKTVAGRTIERIFSHDFLNRLTGVTVNGKPEVAFPSYDPAGNKLAERDIHGHVTTFVYDQMYRLAETISEAVSPDTGDPIRFSTAYDRAGNLVRETDGNGHATVRTYDGMNRLKTETDPVGVTVSYDYDGNGNKTREENLASGLVISYSGYDGLNRPGTMVQTVPDPVNGDQTYTITYTHNDTQHARTITDPRGFKTVELYNGLDQIVQTTVDEGGLSLVTVQQYDALGNRKAVMDPEGHVTQAVHDGLGRPIKEIDAMGRPSKTFYDENNNVIKTVDRRGVVMRHEYDDLDRKRKDILEESISGTGPIVLSENIYDDAARQVTMVDGNRHATLYTYDGLHREVLVQDPLGHTVATVWDGANKRQVTDKRGHATNFEYDAVNRIRFVKDPEPFDDPRYETSYDDGAMTKTEIDKKGIASVTQMDGLGRVVQIKRAGVAMETNVYDGNGNKVLAEDAEGRKTNFVYDGANRLERRIDGFGSPAAAETAYTYDGDGNVLEEKDAHAASLGLAYSVKNTYDVLHRLRTVTDAENDVTEYGYDNEGNRTLVQEPKGFQTFYAYDELGKLLRVTQPGNRITEYTYDDNRNLRFKEDANHHRVEMTYDALNRVETMVQAPGGLNLKTSYTYDPNGNELTLTDPKGHAGGVMPTVTSTYDALNRLKTKTFKGLPAETERLWRHTTFIEYVYDDNDNITETKEQTASGTDPPVLSVRTLRSYDDFDRLVEETTALPNGGTRKVSYTYYKNGLRKTVTDPDGIATTYSYDGQNRLETVITPAGVTTHAYHPDSLLKEVTYPNGVSALYTYYNDDTIRSVTNVRGLSVLSKYIYTYDRNGNRETQEETNGGAPETTQYSYDDLNRLETVTYPPDGAFPNGRFVRYTYDNVGNRTGEETKSATTGALLDSKTGTFDAANRLLELQDNINPSNTVTFGYDANGNQISKTVNSVATEYLYDVRDLLVEVLQSTVSLGRYQYDPEGRRTRKADEEGTKQYVYDDTSILLEYTGDGSRLAKYEYGMDRLISLDHAAEGRRFYSFDALNSVVNLSDDGGSQAARYRLDAWGNFRSPLDLDSSANRFAFTGHLFDKGTGLYQAKARYYDPALGRFITQDAYLGEVEDPPSLHRYMYAYNNPAIYVDPSGNLPILLVPLLIGIIAAEISIIHQEITEGKDLTTVDYGKAAKVGAIAAGAALVGVGAGALALSGTAAAGIGGAGGSALVSTVVGGAASGFTGATLETRFIQEKSWEESLQMGTIGALTGAIGGAAGYAGGAAASSLAARAGASQTTARLTGSFAGGFVGDVGSQAVMVAGGMQEDISFTQALAVGGSSAVMSRFSASRSGRGGCNCFDEETEVATEGGLKPIKDVAVGERVWAKDMDSGSIHLAPVSATFSRTVDSLIILTVGAERIATTTEHPFWVSGKGWIEAGKLQPGDSLLNREGETLAIERIERRPVRQKVYNFEVEDLHSYFISNNGLLVHNACELYPSPLQQRLAAYKAWKTNSGIAGKPTSAQFSRFMGAHRPGSLGKTLYPENTSGFGTWSRGAGSPHGNRLGASGPHDVYAILDKKTRQVYHFGETGRGYKVRGREWVRLLRKKYGLDTIVEPLRTGMQGKTAAKALETRYIKTYEKVFGHKPGFIDANGNFVPIQKTYH